MKLLYITALMVAAAPVSAEIFRCNNAGSVSFSDRPCQTGYQHRLRVTGVDVATVPERPVESGADETPAAQPLTGTRRAQLEASIAVAMKRLDLLEAERRDALGVFDSPDSIDAQVLTHHYSNIIQPLERELEEMRSQLAGMSAL